MKLINILHIYFLKRPKDKYIIDKKGDQIKHNMRLKRAKNKVLNNKNEMRENKKPTTTL